MRLTLPLLLLSLSLGGCEPSPAPPPAATLSGGFLLPPEQKPDIVRTGALRFAVADIEVARSTVGTRVAEFGGYVADDAVERVGDARLLTMSVRVPVARFDALVDALSAIGTVEQRHLEAVDATATVVDTSARLAAKHALEQRYRELTARAGDIDEVLAVERELAKVRGDIESMTAQLAALQDRVAMSTLAITCVQAGSTATVAGFAAALHGGWSALVRVLVSLTYAWPLLALAATIAFVLRIRRQPVPALPPMSPRA